MLIVTAGGGREVVLAGRTEDGTNIGSGPLRGKW